MGLCSKAKNSDPSVIGHKQSLNIHRDDIRPIYPHELPVVDFLLKASGRAENSAELLVSQMDDGGIGSLKFESEAVNRQYGATVAACEFEDTDGILVSVVLNNDEGGLHFKIDVWKVDFTPLLSWPRPEAIRVVGNLVLAQIGQKRTL